MRKIKSRYAKVLFHKDAPYRHKVERDRTKYSRKTKHKNPRKVGDFFCNNLTFLKSISYK